MKRSLKVTVHPTVACSACGEQLTVTAHADLTDPTVMQVRLDPDDRIWLGLFADAHSGAIVST